MPKSRIALAACVSTLLFGAAAWATVQDTPPRNQQSYPGADSPRTGNDTSRTSPDTSSRTGDMSSKRMANAGDAAMPHTPDGFVKKAAQDGMAEVELAKLALSKTQSEQVRSFADRMVKDHTKANAELTSLAKKKNLDVPKDVSADQKKMMEELRGKSGAEFDAAYTQHMKMDHNKAVDLFQMASTMEGFDSDLQQFAKKTLPTLEEHRKIATRLASAEGSNKMSSREGSGTSNR